MQPADSMRQLRLISEICVKVPRGRDVYGMKGLRRQSMADTHLIVIAGPNGSVQTSVTRKFLHHEWAEGTFYINPDIIAQEKYGDWNSQEAVMKAAEYCENLRLELLARRESFVFETVMSSDNKLDFILKAKNAGYFIRLFFIATRHPSINAARIAKRVMEGGHDVPITKIISRYSKAIENCKILSPLVDRLYVYDNSVDNQDARLLFRLRDGEVVKRYVENIPEWAEMILAN